MTKSILLGSKLILRKLRKKKGGQCSRGVRDGYECVCGKKLENNGPLSWARFFLYWQWEVGSSFVKTARMLTRV